MKRIKQWIAALCMTVSMTMTAFGGQWMQDNSGSQELKKFHYAGLGGSRF